MLSKQRKRFLWILTMASRATFDVFLQHFFQLSAFEKCLLKNVPTLHILFLRIETNDQVSFEGKIAKYLEKIAMTMTGLGKAPKQ